MKRFWPGGSMNGFPLRRIARGLVLLPALLWAAPLLAQTIASPITALKNHVSGVVPLIASQIVAQGNSSQTNNRQVGTNDVTLSSALDLVRTYDVKMGALFTTTDTKNGFPRDGAGYEWEQALFDLKRGLLNYACTPASLVNYFAHVAVPAARFNKGYNVRVGAHSWDLSAKTTLKRLDRVSLVCPIASTTTRMANPLGDGIYIEVPCKAAAGLLPAAPSLFLGGISNNVTPEIPPAQRLIKGARFACDPSPECQIS